MRSVLHVIRSLDPTHGGTSACVPALALAVSRAGHYRNLILEFDRAGTRPSREPFDNTELLRAPWSPFRLTFTGGCPELTAAVGRADLGHIHGIWQAHSIATGDLCVRRRVPFLVSTHGMLDRWAVRNKRWKKVLYALLVERRNLRRAVCLHPLTYSEAQDYRRFGLTASVAIVPNGIACPRNVSAEPFLNQFPELRNRQLVLFLGRLHYKKGVDLLCRAWRETTTRFPDSHLVLAGPDFENTAATIRSLISELKLDGRVTITGMLEGDLKWSALAAAELFVLPSHSEGFSVAILEALGMGLPVVITPGCNFPEVATHACGLIANATTADIQAALADILALSDRDRQDMGDRGRALVEREYAWPVIGSRIMEVYDWICGGQKPTHVDLLAV